MNQFTKNQLSKKISEKYLSVMKSWDKKMILAHVWFLVLWLAVVFFAIVRILYIRDLPSINTLWNDIFPESVIIYDKKWNELYNLYSKEKRTSVDISQISKTMQDAIIATEDKTFFTNKWFDFKWLIRAWLNYISGKSDKIQWTSTISQQLIKNSFLTAERSIKRKVQELYLSYKLNSSFSKNKILELYLNKISFWSNAFGIEEASKTFFGKQAKDLGILESSIMSSIPKWPTYYSPYNHRDRLMWYLYVYKEESPKDIIKIDETENPAFYKPLKDKLKSIITDAEITKVNENTTKICKLNKGFFKSDFKIDWAWCIQLDYNDMLTFLNSIKIPYSDLNLEKPNEDLKWYILEYNTWRKDFVLGRMLEDTKIKENEYKNALVEWIDFKFRKYTENIKYPFFIFYVKEFLENKYWKDFESAGWLKIYTSIDPELQDKAEELVKKQVEINKTKYWARNAALVSIDNKTWQILAMVGWADYFDVNAGANVNIITSERQPGSSFKPIVYSYAIEKNPIWPETPIYDNDTKFGEWEPDNYDSKFMGRMPLRKALGYSRNIPAIKVFFYAGWENEIVDYANSLWVSSLKKWSYYGWPLAIWTWELKPLELAQAYSVFANWWYRKDITPIVKIEDSKWNIIEDFKDSEWEQVLSDAAAYVITDILSNPANRPNDFWNNVLTLKWRKVAAKTWTSNKNTTVAWKKKEILPGDLWTAGYTPQITTVVWAGNTDWSATKWSCDWLNCAAPIWHSYMEFAHKNLKKEDFIKPKSVISATISKASGRLASDNTPDDLKVTTIFAVKPTEYDSGGKKIEVDATCNWKVTDETPPDAIKTIYMWSSMSPIIDSYDKSWLKTIWYFTADSYFTGTLLDTPCDRWSKDSAGISISSNLTNDEIIWQISKKVEIRYDANNPIIKIIISKDGKIYKTIPVDDLKWWNIDETIDFTKDTNWSYEISIKAIDSFYYSNEVKYIINVWEKTIQNTNSWTSENSSNVITPNPVSLEITNPTNGKVNIYKDQFFNLRWTVSAVPDVLNVYVDGSLFKILEWTKNFLVPINEDNTLEVWQHSVKVEVISGWKTVIKEISVTVLAR
ncbi:MAG: 1A family penicillin-binding protein [uncultured bacterium (gcode 4)]|uniref:peptidoglycan glycosyltransferase n=1 Tax=uncultured bacterium (gcode 4) TaxID=1234023 RepID=K2AVW3_9BACT|nr:MAG: 1A family penicillin-binding protein [uncultured bacterium (gcode 4)]